MGETLFRRILAATAVGWSVALILGAFIASRREIGVIAYLASATIYTVGSLVCHQQAVRSFHLWGAQVPVCARCAGLYAGAAIATAAAATVRLRPGRALVGRPAINALLLAALPTA